MTICPICNLEHGPRWKGSECLQASLSEIIRLRTELESCQLRERAALGQATLARQSAHELGDKLRELQARVLGAGSDGK